MTEINAERENGSVRRAKDAGLRFAFWLPLFSALISLMYRPQWRQKFTGNTSKNSSIWAQAGSRIQCRCTLQVMGSWWGGGRLEMLTMESGSVMTIKACPWRRSLKKVYILVVSLRMTTALVVETSVTNNSLPKDYPHPDDHTRQTNNTSSLQKLRIKQNNR